jgi:hypothetical protein
MASFSHELLNSSQDPVRKTGRDRGLTPLESGCSHDRPDNDIITSDNGEESELRIRKEANGDMVPRRICRKVRPRFFSGMRKTAFSWLVSL